MIWMMQRELVFLLLSCLLNSAKYIPKSSDYHPISSPNFMFDLHHQGRLLDDIDVPGDVVESYRLHRYYGITTRNGINHYYGWREIKETGIRSSTSDVDDIYFEKIKLPDWDFRFYGHLHNELYISANGFLTVMADYAQGPCGKAFCNWNDYQLYLRCIAPLRTDFDPSARNDSEIFYKFDYNQEEKENILIVQWERVTLWHPNKTFVASPFTFQVILEEDGDIIFNYKELPFNPRTKILDGHISYPLFIGLEDSFILEDSFLFQNRSDPPTLDGTKWDYLPLILNWTEITHDFGRSLHLEAFPTCQQYKTCYECTNATTTNINILECGYCGEINLCLDSLGWEIGSLEGVCMMNENENKIQRNFLQCDLFKSPPCISHGLDWPDTPAGHIAKAPCGDGSHGQMMRTCSKFSGEWGHIDSTACGGNSLSKIQIGLITVGCITVLFTMVALLWKLLVQRRDLQHFQRLKNHAGDTGGAEMLDQNDKVDSI